MARIRTRSSHIGLCTNLSFVHTQIASGNILKTMALMAPEPKGISARRGLAAVG